MTLAELKSVWLTTDFLHPMDRGGKIRTYNILKELRKHHDVTYLGFDGQITGESPLKRVHEYCHRAVAIHHYQAGRRDFSFYTGLAANFFSSLPYSVAKLRNRKATEKCESELRQNELDYLVVDFVQAAVNMPQHVSVPSILFQHNVEAVIWERLYKQQTNPILRQFYKSQWQRMFNFEREACRRFDCIIAVSENDAERLRNDYGLEHVAAIPTAVDTDYFCPNPSVSRQSKSMVFVGSLDWTPNVDGLKWFVELVMPIILRTVPDAKLKVVGRSPRADLVSGIKGRPGVELVGPVDDVRPFVQGAVVSVVPLLVGGGTRIKIFESLALETPVVSTSIGAEGLPLENGKHLLIADSPEAFAKATIRVLNEDLLALTLGTQGGEYVRARFGAESVAREFASICQETVERFRRSKSL